jgi:hypothetical protein
MGGSEEDRQERTQMRRAAWKLYDRSMNRIAAILFPANKPTRFRIGSYQIHSTDVTLVLYTLLGGIALAWLFSNWLWIPATILSMVMAWMVMTWFF